jgi:ADP-ribose pyrophosphatase YjhB (NUDIX family)
MFTLGAFAVIADEQGRVLLCRRRDRPVWNLPGGGVQPGEMPDEAAIRETREETGLEIRIDRLTGVYGKTNRDDLVFVFRATVIGGQLQTTDEAERCEFFAVAAMPDDTLVTHRERIQDAMAGQSDVIMRRHSSPAIV